MSSITALNEALNGLLITFNRSLVNVSQASWSAENYARNLTWKIRSVAHADFDVNQNFKTHTTIVRFEIRISNVSSRATSSVNGFVCYRGNVKQLHKTEMETITEWFYFVTDDNVVMWGSLN